MVKDHIVFRPGLDRHERTRFANLRINLSTP